MIITGLNQLYSVDNLLLSVGRGIFTSGFFEQGDFVVEYRGDLITAAEADQRRERYDNTCSVYMFDFTWNQKTWW